MKKIVALLGLTLSLSIIGFTQTKTGRINGKVMDGNQKTIESATITLLRAKDSFVVKMASADKNGSFSFDNIIEGKYVVSITAVGHEKGYSDIFEITADKTSIELKTIELIPQTKVLSGVAVTAKKPLVEQKLDRTIINVEAAATNVGATALEVLEKSPGITVD